MPSAASSTATSSIALVSVLTAGSFGYRESLRMPATAISNTAWRWVMLCIGRPPHSAPKVLKPIGRQLSVAHRVLDVFVAQIGLQRPRVMALVSQGEAAGMAQHMRMGLELEASRGSGT